MNIIKLCDFFTGKKEEVQRRINNFTLKKCEQPEISLFSVNSKDLVVRLHPLYQGKLLEMIPKL